jgi:hypothetical protein
MFTRYFDSCANLWGDCYASGIGAKPSSCLTYPKCYSHYYGLFDSNTETTDFNCSGCLISS